MTPVKHKTSIIDESGNVITFEWNKDGTKIAISKSNNLIVIKSFNVLENQFESSSFSSGPLKSQTLSSSSLKLSKSILENAHKNPVGSISWDPKNPNRFVSVGNTPEVKLWELISSTNPGPASSRVKFIHKETYQLPNHSELEQTAIKNNSQGRNSYKDYFNAVKFNSTGDLMALLTYSNNIHIVSTQTFKALIQFTPDPKVIDFDWAPNSECLALALYNGELQFHKLISSQDTNESDVESGFTKLIHSLKLSFARLNSVKFTNDGKYIITGANDSTVSIVDSASLLVLKTIKNEISEPVSMIDTITHSDGKTYISITYEQNEGSLIYNLDDILSCPSNELEDEDKAEDNIKDCTCYYILPAAKFNPANPKVLAYNDAKGRCKLASPLPPLSATKPTTTSRTTISRPATSNTSRLINNGNNSSTNRPNSNSRLHHDRYTSEKRSNYQSGSDSRDRISERNDRFDRDNLNRLSNRDAATSTIRSGNHNNTYRDSRNSSNRDRNDVNRGGNRMQMRTSDVYRADRRK